MKPSILIVDDEETMLDLLTMILEQDFSITTENDGAKALQLLHQQTFDLCLLDIMMPWTDGLDLLKQLRSLGNGVPVIFISARGELEDRVEGLELGADDYITKPFEPTEVIARVKSVLRRTGKELDQQEIKQSGIHIHLLAREARINGEKLKLTPIEFELLATLIQHPKQAFSREQLLERIWDYSYMGEARTVDTHIKNLRLKLRKAGFQEEGIQTIWGFGYKWGV
ncbi:two-component system, OmpR family, response regulator ResD [Thermoactinomyces sp. DSM 45891]|uniref:response regulator transcription factor n=1 Tax=Thermoactinomyces sp. DSM 45891 TaxID=1761907 RepID=UPI0009219485|nr:response regulator transcription factor [Thermoactinomyces sp. DSM 45891]SFX80937.1 two-component system, OmpR family, response regulator ResD [Thermoactinomyces sp. DSM 45891]